MHMGRWAARIAIYCAYTRSTHPLLEALHEVLQVFWRHVDARLAHLINH